MSTLSIRSLPPGVEKALIKEAKRQKKTKTEIVLAALEKSLGLTHESQRRKELRRFFGKMTREDFKVFQEATHAFAEIEKELWD
ncbi:MAG: hypothetical protein HYY44_09780 [Deltaproteobacteria bacterium]|nr:hypothetical protein [Deltaproteobacteria bacterium]